MSQKALWMELAPESPIMPAVLDSADWSDAVHRGMKFIE